jgi:hypothetical protein
MIEERESIKPPSSAQQAAPSAGAAHRAPDIIREAGRQREDIVRKAIAAADQLRTDLQAQAKIEAGG